MSYQSEAQLENKLIDLLIKNGYEKVTINNESELEENFRKQLNLFNLEKLNNKELTDNEFRRILNKLKAKTVVQSALILRDKLELERENGDYVYLDLISDDVNKNIYQVTNQITVRGKYENRYDVTILINGLPIIQIELKRRGLDIKEAFNQICRYKDHSFVGLFSYLQLFVVSNGIDTRYFANANSKEKLHFEFIFFWTDEKNNRITKLSEFTNSFLNKEHITEILNKYMVIKEEQGLLIVLRPYQIYAVESIISKATNSTSNGYIWHSTGSGKTLTSFKTSEILSKNTEIKKVFFLVDRVDLDDQTVKEFNAFAPGSVDETDDTATLERQLRDINNHIIVTTIHKMANLIRNPKYYNIIKEYEDKKVIFVIDECHRSQFGLMHRDIRKHFKKSQYFGFTGTPIFEKNMGQDKRTTADLFDECLHYYLMKDAIFDGNVLGFLIEYISTIKGDSWVHGRDEYVEDIDRQEVYRSNEHYELVVDNILKYHSKRTNNKTYNAILATDSIESLMTYYDIFNERDHDLTIGAIFSYQANMDLEGEQEHDRDKLERVIKDYNVRFDTNFSTETNKFYRANLDKKFREGEIDILIVVDMFLTGYDSNILNTLYVDKNLKYHGLLQAYSRTNRVHNANKPFGNIICYRNLKDNTDEALRMFSKIDEINDLLAEPYEDLLAEFKDNVAILKSIAETPQAIDFLKSEEEQKEFIEVFKDITKGLLKMENYMEFKFTKEDMKISEQEYQDYKSKYFAVKEVHDKQRLLNKASILDDIDFELEIMHRDKVNVDYIMNLIKNINMEDKDKQKQDMEHIFKELNRADSRELRSKLGLIKEFLSTVVPKLDNLSEVDNEFEEFESERKRKKIDNFIKENNLDKTMMVELIKEYEFTGIINLQLLRNILLDAKYGLLERRRKTDEIAEFVISLVAEHN